MDQENYYSQKVRQTTSLLKGLDKEFTELLLNYDNATKGDFEELGKKLKLILKYSQSRKNEVQTCRPDPECNSVDNEQRFAVGNDSTASAYVCASAGSVVVFQNGQLVSQKKPIYNDYRVLSVSKTLFAKASAAFSIATSAKYELDQVHMICANNMAGQLYQTGFPIYDNQGTYVWMRLVYYDGNTQKLSDWIYVKPPRKGLGSRRTAAMNGMRTVLQLICNNAVLLVKNFEIGR